MALQPDAARAGVVGHRRACGFGRRTLRARHRPAADRGSGGREGGIVRLALTAAVIFGLMAIEARRAALNERTQRAAGGIEPPGDVYPLMQVAYPGAFLAMIVEGALRGGAPALLAALGVAVFTAAKALKWWAILTLGRAWTFRVLVVPGARRIASGPYRFFNHPNYLAVVGELLGAALICGAVLTGPAATAFFLVLILKRIAVENRAVATNLRS